MTVVKLETFFHETRLGLRSIRCGNHSLSEIKATHLGAAGYIIAQSVAGRLLELSSRFDRQVDEFLFDPKGPVKGINCYQINPAICIQDPNLKGDDLVLPSVIDADRKNVLSAGERTDLAPAKRKGLAKLKRELVRPFERFGMTMSQLGRLIVHGERTLEVPYDRPAQTSRYFRRLRKLQSEK